MFRAFKNSNYDQRQPSHSLGSIVSTNNTTKAPPPQTATPPPSPAPSIRQSTHPQLLHIDLLPFTDTTPSSPLIHRHCVPFYSLPQVISEPKSHCVCTSVSSSWCHLLQISMSFGNNHPHAQDRGNAATANASSMPTLPTICNINTTNCYVGCNIVNYFHEGSGINPPQQATADSSTKSDT